MSFCSFSFCFISNCIDSVPLFSVSCPLGLLLLLLLLSRFSRDRLYDPIDSSPPGSPIPGILQARTLEWIAISFSKAWKGKVKEKSFSRVRLFATPWTAAYQAPPSLGFSRQERWSGCHFLLQCMKEKSESASAVYLCCCCSVAKLCLTLQLDELQHSRLPCPSQSPRVSSNPCPLSRWCHPTISSSVAPFFFCPQSFPALESFPMSQLFTSGGQSIGASASAPVLPVNIEGWFPLGLIGLISLCLMCNSSKIVLHQDCFGYF